MHKNQKVQLNGDRKETTTKTLETAAEKLETLKLETAKVDNHNIINVGQATKVTTNQAPKVLAISESTIKNKPISKNNFRTPVRGRFVFSEEDFDFEISGSRKTTKKNASKNSQARKETTATSNQEPKIPISDETTQAGVSEDDQTSEKIKEKPVQKPEVPKIVKPDPRTVCTCEILKQKEPVPLVIPKRDEPKNVPKYRWVAVKSGSLKTEEEKAKEISALLQKTTPKTPQTATNIRKKPRLCTFCWSNVLKARQQEEQKRRREWMVAQQTEKKSNKPKKTNPKTRSKTLVNNQFGYLLDEST